MSQGSGRPPIGAKPRAAGGEERVEFRGVDRPVRTGRVRPASAPGPPSRPPEAAVRATPSLEGELNALLAKHDPKTQAERRRPLSASVAGRPPLVGSIQETPTKRVREVSNAMLGASLADFETLEQLGRGSFGVVSKVRDRRDGKVYVSKAIRVDQLKAHRQREALAEVLNMRRVDHVHIVKLFAAFVEDGHLYIIMEYAERGDLHHAIKRRAAAKQPFTEAELWPMFWQMCLGLQHLHDHRIIHRDIKPLNLFQTASGCIKIGDLGVSRVVQEERMLVKSRVGTPLFLAPELVAKRPYSFAVDVWSVGCVMYNLAALQTPFRGADVDELGKSIVKDPVPPLPARFSAAFVRLVSHALEKDPAKRPSIRELVQMFPRGIAGVDTRQAAGPEAATPPRAPVVIGPSRAVHPFDGDGDDAAAGRRAARPRPVSHYGRLQQIQAEPAVRVPKNTREVHVKQFRMGARPASAAGERPAQAADPRKMRPASARADTRKPFLHVETKPFGVTSRLAMRRIHERPQSAGALRSPQGAAQPARRPAPLMSPTTRQNDAGKVIIPVSPASPASPTSPASPASDDKRRADGACATSPRAPARPSVHDLQALVASQKFSLR